MVPDKNHKFHWGQQFSTKFDVNYFSYLNPIVSIDYVVATVGMVEKGSQVSNYFWCIK